MFSREARFNIGASILMNVIDETTSDLVDMAWNDLGALSKKQSSEDYILSWLHFKARSIPPRPRTVTYSEKVRNVGYPVIDEMCERLRKGLCMSPYLGSSYHRNPGLYEADPMFNDWKIAHFHLKQVSVSKNKKIDGTAELLFAYITANDAIFLDVKRHGAWTDRELLRILASEKPDIFNQYKLESVVGLSRQTEDNHVQTLRAGGVNTAHNTNGGFYISPGLGITTSRHAVRLVRFLDSMLAIRDDLIKHLQNLRVLEEIKIRYPYDENSRFRLGIKYDKGVFTFYEKETNQHLLESMPIE